MNHATNSNPARSLTLEYLKLLRIPNVFTAVADIMMGFAFAQTFVWQPLALCLLVFASGCLYLAGMVLNDVFDYEVDRRDRPHRPLPSGRIRRTQAACLGTGLLFAGVAFGWSTSLLSELNSVPVWRTGLIATLLAVAVLLYDGGLKKSPFGCVVMGACRSLNVLLGMSVDPRLTTAFDFSPSQWLIALGMGIYVAGITLFARHEAKTSHRASLIGALAVMVIGIALLAVFPWAGLRTRLTHDAVWPVLLFLLTAPIWRRCVVATLNPQPKHVQEAVKQAIMALIVLNAALSMTVAGAWYGLAVLCLLAPSMILGRWIYST